MIKLINNFTPVKLSSQQQSFFLYTLAQLLKNGFSLEMALESLKLLLPRQQTKLQFMIEQLQRGFSLAIAFEQLGLSKTILSQLAIAEVHGDLIKCLQENANTLKMRHQNWQKVLNLLAYPCFLLFCLASLLVFLKLELAQQLPPLRLAAPYRVGICLFSLVIIGVILVEVWFWQRVDDLHKALHQIKWPFIGRIYQNYYYYVVLSGLATFLKSGLSLQDILTASQQLTKGSLQQCLAQQVKEKILAGQSLKQIINSQPLLANEINLAINLGHERFQMAVELATLGQLKHEQLQKQLRRLINQIQPFFFLIVAGMILLTYLSILLPIYSMMKGF